MGSVKTAVSMQRSLFEQVEQLAHVLNTSRSHLVSMALEEYIRRREGRELLERINAALVEGPTPSEQHLLDKMRLRHRTIVEGEW
ncbi:MAG: hypothetical protein Q7O66_19920 [Dehalococcoidia bacterium]|nr:hypothetical protein [Dehalococcoidia bacterium]